MVRTIAIAALCVATVAAQPAPSGAVLYQNARLIAGDGAPAIERAALLIEGGRITRVGNAGSITAPAGVMRVDLAGKTIMPALIGTHVPSGLSTRDDLRRGKLQPRYRASNDLNRALFFGVAVGAVAWHREPAMSLYQTCEPSNRPGASVARGCSSPAGASAHPMPVPAARSTPVSPTKSRPKREATGRSVQELAARKVDHRQDLGRRS